MAKGVMLTDVFNNQLEFYWNLHTHVGPGCANRVDDVNLVQVAYSCMKHAWVAQDTLNKYPEMREIIRKIDPFEPYSGASDAPLSQAIRFHQKIRGGTQDGRVSPIVGKNCEYALGQTWMLIPLNTYIATVLRDNRGGVPNYWPKLERYYRCPTALAEVSKSTLAPPTGSVI